MTLTEGNKFPVGPVFDSRLITPTSLDSESGIYTAKERIGTHDVFTIIRECDPAKVTDDQLELYAEVTNEAAWKVEDLGLGLRLPSDGETDIRMLLKVNGIYRIQQGRNGLQTVARFIHGPQLSQLIELTDDEIDTSILGKVTAEQEYRLRWLARTLKKPEIALSVQKGLERASATVNTHLRTKGINFRAKDTIATVDPQVSLFTVYVTDIATRINDIQRLPMPDQELEADLDPEPESEKITKIYRDPIGDA